MNALVADGKIVGLRKANIVGSIAAFLVIGAMSALTISPASAQPAGKAFRIGYLNPTSQSTSFLPVFRQGLGELGYLEGRNLVLEERYADDQPERLSALATELVDLKVAAHVTFATPATLAAKRASSTIPIVMIELRRSDQVIEGARLLWPGAADRLADARLGRVLGA